MEIIAWKVPVPAAHRRSLELLGIEYNHSRIVIRLAEEDSSRVWRLHFTTVQALKVVTWECGAHSLSDAPDGGFLEVDASPWLLELGRGKQAFIEKSRHFIVSTYDDIVEVAAWSGEFALDETTA